MKLLAFAVASLALLSWSPAACEDLGNVFLVLMQEIEASGNRASYVLEDNYCLDPVLPRDQRSCRIRVLAPRDSVYSESRISNLSLDFRHPSRPASSCHVRWSRRMDPRTWCEGSDSGTGGRWRTGYLPAFREERAASGSVDFYRLLQSEHRCHNDVKTIRYYRDGLSGFPEWRPTVVFRTSLTGCVAGIVTGRRANYFRTTEAPCVYNGRRRCRPLTKGQYDSLIRDIEGSELYVDFRTTSVRP